MASDGDGTRDARREGAAPDNVRCAYCHEPDPDELCELCPLCSAAMHPQCWAESRRCTTLGCTFQPSKANLRRDAEEAQEGDAEAAPDGEPSAGFRVATTIAFFVVALIVLYLAGMALVGPG